MTESPTDVAIRFVGQQVETLRATLHDELAAMRTDITTLGLELRHHVAGESSRLAVLEHRMTEVEKDVAALQGERNSERAERDRERLADRRLRTQLLCTAGLSLLGTLVAVLIAVSQASGG